MRKRPKDIETEKFINSSSDGLSEGQDDIYRYVKGNRWPLEKFTDLCSLAAGSDLKKPLLINMSEKEWNTIERHVKDLNISKSEWVRNIIFSSIKREQELCLRKDKNNN